MTRCFKVMLPILSGVKSLECLLSMTVIFVEISWVDYCRVEGLSRSVSWYRELSMMLVGVWGIYIFISITIF